jgi:hypothetical protein
MQKKRVGHEWGILMNNYFKCGIMWSSTPAVTACGYI